MSAAVRLLQIVYDARTRAMVDPAFEPLDNLANARPDWYEYWPIRSFLDANALEEGVYYGFFSPRFAEKTRLSGAQLRAFVARADGADVVTFSPFPEHAACFLNVYEQGALFHPGLAEAARAFLAEVMPALRLEALVTHTRQTVFANFFVARPAFWRRWREIVERGVALAETPGTPLHGLLGGRTEHHGQSTPQLKIFVLERIATLLIATEGFRAANYPPFEMAFSHPYFVDRFSEVIALDALKLAYAASGDAHYRKCFRALQDRLLGAPGAPWADRWAALRATLAPG